MDMEKKMRICFVSGNISRSGGTERVSILVANELKKRGYEVSFLSIWPGENAFFEMEKGIKIHVVMHGNLEKHFYRTKIYPVKKIRWILKKEKYDVLICVDTLLTSLIYPSMKGLPIKLIAWEHFNYDHTLTDPKRIKALNIAAQYADRIVVLTKADLNMHVYKAKIASSKMEQIYNPISFTSDTKCDIGCKRVIAVGRLTNQKGFDRLLNIWSKIEEEVKDWKLEILGDGELEQQLKMQCDKLHLKQVVFEPKTADVVSHYKDASIYAMTSRYEGFPMVLLEAVTMGLPLISYDCHTGPSEIIKDGVNGFLIEDDNQNLYVEKLLELIKDEDLRQRMGKESSIMASSFNIKTIGDKWEKLLKIL